MSLPVGQNTVERNIANVKVRSIHAGVVAPEFEATTLDGKPFKLSDHRGKIVLVDFWATWCGPCIAELPNVKSLYDEFGGDNFVVVGISFDRDAATARKFTSDRQLPWIQIWAEKADEGPIASLYGVGGVPATFLIGSDGKVIERDLRGDDLAKTVAREVRKLAGGVAPEKSMFAGLVSRFVEGIAEAMPPALPEESPEARAVLEETVARYRALTSYRDSFCSVARLVQKNEAPQEGRITGALAWAGNRIAAKSDLLHVYGDGREITRYWPAVGRYMRQDQPTDLSEALRAPEWSPFGQEGPGLHPLAAMLAVDDDDDTNMPILVVTGVEAVTRDNRSGRVLRGRFRVDGLSHGDALPFEAFIDDQRHLFEEFRLDYTEAYRTALRESYEGDPDAVEQAEIVITFRDIETNAPIEDAAFVLNAPGAREYDPFSSARISKLPQPDELLGRTAPALVGTARDGSSFDLAAQRGKVVLVVFWATWAPQAEAVLRELQSLATTSAANVSLIGVGRNGAAGDAAARQVIALSGAAYPQASDHDGSLGEAWNVTCLPLIYVVDPDGRVCETFLTWSDDTRQALADCLAKTASGESTARSEAQVARAKRKESGGLTLKAENEPLGDARVTVGAIDQISVSRWNMSEQDIDDDGETELIFPDWQGSLTILKPRTGTVHRLRLPGLEGTGMQTVRGVRIDGETCWLCTASRYAVSGAREETLVCFYSPRGELLWKFQPDVDQGVEAQAQAAAGDLDGDGRIEYVIGLTTFTREQIGENQYTLDSMGGRLIWLDHQGRRIAERELENQLELLYLSEALGGKPATLLCISGGQLERYTLAPEQGSD